MPQRDRYTVDTSPLCREPVRIDNGKLIFVLDGHIRGPLIEELERHFAFANPGYDFCIVTEYSEDWPSCDVHTRDCEQQHKAWLYVRERGVGPLPFVCSPFVARWLPSEMRERWRPALTDPEERHADWPFDPPPLEGDVPATVVDES